MVKSIMIVDDSEPDQFLSKFAVESFDPNVEILQAYDGQEALDILDKLETHPDIIFLDINMPRMNGHEFLEEFTKRDIITPTVVMLSSSDQTTDVERTKDIECVKKYQMKPLTTDIVKSVSELVCKQNDC